MRSGAGGASKRDGLGIAALVPNMKGYERARDNGVKRVAVVVSTADTFNLRNINMTVAQAMGDLSVGDSAGTSGWHHGAWVCVGSAGLPGYGRHHPGGCRAQLTEQLINGGAHEISIADTIGVNNPKQNQGYFATAGG